MKREGKTFHTHRNHLIPFYPKEPSLFPHIQMYIEQNPEIFHDFDSTDMIQNVLYTSYNNSGFDDKIFDDDLFCNDDDDQSITIGNEFYKATNLDGRLYHHP